MKITILVLLSILLLVVTTYFAGINNIGYGGWATPRPGDPEYETNTKHRKFWKILLEMKTDDP